MARPSKSDKILTEKKLIKISEWVNAGMTDADIANNLGIAYSTFREWVKKHDELSAVLKINKDSVDDNVERSLYQRAIGYAYDEVTKERVINSETKQVELVVTKIVTKTVIPDTTAQIFWLKNRRPDVWREKSDLNITGEAAEVAKAFQQIKV